MPGNLWTEMVHSENIHIVFTTSFLAVLLYFLRLDDNNGNFQQDTTTALYTGN